MKNILFTTILFLSFCRLEIPKDKIPELGLLSALMKVKSVVVGATGTTDTGTGTNTGTGTGTGTGTVSPPSSLTYTGSPYTYTVGTAITTVTPTITGTVTSCTANPTLPTGLSIIATTCAISGTPNAVSTVTSYSITASNSGGSVTVSISITVNAACSTSSSVTYSWGTFTEMCDGTIKFVGVAGTFGGQTYTAQTLYFAKCSYGQTYSGGTCTGTATTVTYCSADNSSCDNGTILNGTGTSGAYTACSSMNSGAGTYGKTNWRVPTKNELKTLINCTDQTMPTDIGYCASYTSPTINILFPNTHSGPYWSSSADASLDAWYVLFNVGSVNSIRKITLVNARCISGQ